MSSVRTQRDGPVLTLTIDRPERRNSLDDTVLDGLIGGLEAARRDPEVRVVVLTGAGEEAFCAGADLGAAVGDPTSLAAAEGRGRLRELFAAAAAADRPLIARVNGHALAGGFGVALMCDLIVAADHATFGTPEVRVGLWPYMISRLIIDHLGPKRALELMLTGRRLTAAEAYEWGLVNRVVPAAELDAAVSALVAELLRGAPVAQRLGRRSYYLARDLPHDAATAYLHGMLELNLRSPDVAEGIAAFFERRGPRWQDR